jgi:curved DNA-binding protein CbpA
MESDRSTARDADDPFDLLGLPARMDLSSEAIRRAHLRLQAASHPDALPHAGAPGPSDEVNAQSDAGAIDATVRAARLNRARALLENPESRADALLRRLGGPAKEQDKSLPDGFLMEVMQARQESDEEIGQEVGENPGARERWRDWARERRAGHVAAIVALLDPIALGHAPRSGDALRAARRELNAWRYIERFLEQLDPHA